MMQPASSARDQFADTGVFRQPINPTTGYRPTRIATPYRLIVSPAFQVFFPSA